MDMDNLTYHHAFLLLGPLFLTCVGAPALKYGKLWILAVVAAVLTVILLAW